MQNPMEFEVGKKVFIKLALMKGMIRFGTKGKLSLKYTGPFDIMERIKNLSY